MTPDLMDSESLAVAAPNLYASLAPRYRAVPIERLESYLERTLEGASLDAVEDVLGTLAKVGQAVLPVLLPAIGTAIGGPIGGAVGAGAGVAASAGIKAATAGKKSPTPRPAPAPPAPPSPPAKAPAANRPGAVAGRPSAPPPAQTAAAQLLALILSREVLQAMGQLLLGGVGKQTVSVNGEAVRVPAVLSLIAELADRAAEEAVTRSPAGTLPAYLAQSDESGAYDITSAADRAEALWTLFRDARAEDLAEIEARSWGF